MSDANTEDVNDITQQEKCKEEKTKRVVKLRSKVWIHFTKIDNKPGKCQCNYCERVFSCSSKGGTTHLHRHIDDRLCTHYKKGTEDKSQTLLTYMKGNSRQGSTVVPWKFDQERSRRDLAELIISRELPFSFVEDPSFQKFIWGIYPKYKFVSRNTIRSDCLKRYEEEKNILKDVLKISSQRVCLTTDTWTSSQELPYLALTAHFIDNNWILHKKIINFVLVPLKATGENLADIIVNCLLEWNIEKICTITMDNHSANDVVARTLSDHYSSRGSLLLHGRVLQVRCWAHILNLIVQDGLDEIKDSIRRVRNAVKYVKVSPRRKIEFLEYADQERIPRSRALVLDVCTRWNSTYLMLGSALHYRRAYDCMRTRDPHFKDPPTLEDWEKAEIVHGFLEAFYIATNIFSGSKYCTSNLFFREAYRILRVLRESAADSDSLIGNMAQSMLLKFQKYWVEKEPNILLSIAAVLDPRFKLKYLRFCYNNLYDSYLVTSLMARVGDELRYLFDEYLAEYEASIRVDETSNKIVIIMLVRQLVAPLL